MDNQPRIDVFRPMLGQEELAAVASTFGSGWVGKGQRVAEFEAAWAAHIGVDPQHVVSVNCATEGLFQVCQMLNLQPGSEVIMPSVHFIGAANAVLASRAAPVFCDVDKHTLNPTLDHIRAVHSRRWTKAVILLHYGGVAQELPIIRQWCERAGVVLIEDAACAQATISNGKAAGTWGHFGIWSFDAMKVMTCGDGGMIYCDYDREAADKLRQRIYLGMDSQSGLSSDKDRWWEFTVNAIGRRSIMNDISASIGLEQLKKLPAFVERRRQIARYYDESLKYLVTVSPDAPWVEPPYYFYWIQTERRDELARYLRSQGIYVTFKYHPLHRVFRTGQHLPGAEYAADHTLLLPLHQGLSDDDVLFVCEKVKEFFR